MMRTLIMAAALIAASTGAGLAQDVAGPQVADLLLILDADERHFGVWDFGPGILDVFLEGRLTPDDAGILVGVGIAVIRDGAGLRSSKR